MNEPLRPRPRVLHLLSDWKWTGPAEPIVNLCRQLRHHGLHADFACTRPPKRLQGRGIVPRAAERHVEPILDFNLHKGANPVLNFADIRHIAEYIDREEIQIIHTHTGHDHYIGSRAARKANNQPFVVRSNHRGEPLKPTALNKWLVNGHTDAWVALTQSCLDADIAAFGIDPKYAMVAEGAVDLERFHPGISGEEVRREFGLGPEHVLAGIVARVQSRRRFDVLIPAIADAMAQEPHLRFVIIGRGTNLQKLAKDPVRQYGIENKVFFTGYLGEEFPAHLAAFDFKIFLVPGSDGSCRAVREAMAVGKPILAARRGLLPELVEHGQCGLVIDDSQENLTAAIVRMARDKEMREQFGRAAAEKARACFRIDDQAEAIAELYVRLAEAT